MFKAVIKDRAGTLVESVICYDVKEVLDELALCDYVCHIIDSNYDAAKIVGVGAVPQSTILRFMYLDVLKDIYNDTIDRLAYNIIMPKLESEGGTFTLETDDAEFVEFSLYEDEEEEFE